MFPNALNGKYTTREKNSFHKPNNGEHLNQAPSMPSYALYGPKQKKAIPLRMAPFAIYLYNLFRSDFNEFIV